jgi:hypothetical protein
MLKAVFFMTKFILPTQHYGETRKKILPDTTRTLPQPESAAIQTPIQGA